MAVEKARGCGYRKVGGIYLVGGMVFEPCDRLPFELHACPVCGGGIHFSRSYTSIEPLKLFGVHQPCGDKHSESCPVCNPPDGTHYLMGVGEQFYSVESFMKEAAQMGVSKRVAAIPKGLKVGETVIYLTHRLAVQVVKPNVLQQALAIVAEAEGQRQPRLLEADEVEFRHGIFTAFVPQRIEQLIWKSEATEERLADMVKRGITPVIIPDGDRDHAPRRGRKEEED